MKLRHLLICLLTIATTHPFCHAESVQPASLSIEEVTLPTDLDPARTKLLKTGFELTKSHGWLKYKFGAASPQDGGFDCSGATYYLLRQIKLTPPRTSSGQYLWVCDQSNFTEVGKATTSLKDPVFEALLPGDLLFWSGTYEPTDKRTTKISHVAIYAGKDANGTPIMLNSSDGRSYQGKKQNGYGVFEFRLPSATSKSTFVGFGTPPGLINEKD